MNQTRFFILSNVEGNPVFYVDVTSHTDEFRAYLAREGVKSVRCQVRAPDCNAIAERFMRLIKKGCLDRMILYGEVSFCLVLTEYVAHYHAEINHQGIGNRSLERLATVSTRDKPIRCQERLRGMLKFNYREAA